MVTGRKDKSVMNDERSVNRDLREGPFISTNSTGPSAGQNITREPDATDRSPNNRAQDAMVPLFSGNESDNLRSRWENVQVSFVDEPRRAVEQADRLVTETIDGLSKGFAAQRERLEQQWHRDQNVSTEELRVAFRRYRSFFERLLSMQ
jgi:hypothetical protein